MKKLTLAWICALLCGGTVHSQNNYEGNYTRPLSSVVNDVQKRFNVRLRFDMDTTGLKLPFADFRIRPYSVEETLTNICRYYDWNWWKRSGKLYRISRYEYYRRHPEEGKAMLDYLSALYNNKVEWEKRRETLRREVRERLEIDAFLDSCISRPRVTVGKIMPHDGYTTQNICMELIAVDGKKDTTAGETASAQTGRTVQHIFGTIYAPDGKAKNAGAKGKNALKKGSGKHPLIICPDGHWPTRYREDEQQRLGTLARMGAVCVDFDLYGYGQSEAEVGRHDVARAHIFQAACGLKLLDYMLDSRKDIDRQHIGVCGGSGGGTHTVLLSLLRDDIAAIAPVVHVASHFDGGCPCESGMPVQLAAGGTCEAELAATFAPRKMLLVSDGGDWTHTTEQLEMPFIRRIYDFYDAGDNVENVHLKDEKHDFGPQKRKAVYDFFARVFGLDITLADEQKVTILPPESLKSSLE